MLQSGTGGGRKYGRCHKVGPVLQNVATFITKKGRYYKVGKLLQSRVEQRPISLNVNNQKNAENFVIFAELNIYFIHNMKTVQVL